MLTPKLSTSTVAMLKAVRIILQNDTSLTTGQLGASDGKGLFSSVISDQDKSDAPSKVT